MTRMKVVLHVLFAGSPFYCALVDGRKATASGDGLTHVPTSRPAYFNVHTSGVGEAELEVQVLCKFF